MNKIKMLLVAMLSTACSTMHIPNAGFEDSIPGSGGRAQLNAAGGNTQTLGFNEFEITKNKSNVTTTNVGSFALGGSLRFREKFEASLGSFSMVPFPSLAGLKYQFLEEGNISASISMKAGYSVFSNRGGYSPIGACTGNSKCGIDDPNGRFVGGNLWAYMLGVPLGFQVSEALRIVVNPQVTYFDGRYTFHEKLQPTDTEYAEGKHGLSGLRKSFGVSGFYRLGTAWAAHLTAQFHDYTWNDFSRSQQLSAYLGFSYVVGSAVP